MAVRWTLPVSGTEEAVPASALSPVADVPAAPTVLAFSNTPNTADANYVGLQWTDNSTTETQYIVEASDIATFKNPYVIMTRIPNDEMPDIPYDANTIVQVAPIRPNTS